jgi:uncharacterized MAPEG superfamily protein
MPFRLALLLVGLAGPAFAQAPADPFVIDPDLGGGPLPREILSALFEPYAHALAALAFWAVLMIVLAILSTTLTPRARAESGHPVRDYADPAYRRHRAFQNALEAATPFVAATLAAILTGAGPFLVNLLASVFVLARIATAAVHIGTENQPARSATWSVGHLCILGLAVMAIWGAFT